MTKEFKLFLQGQILNSHLTKVNPDENGDQVVVTLLLPIAQIIAKYIRKILLTVTPL
jgi:hypothetical protein